METLGPEKKERAWSQIEAGESRRLMGSHFTLNMGQIHDDDVVLHSENAYFTPTGVVFRVVERPRPSVLEEVDGHAIDLGMHIYKMEFEDANIVPPTGKVPLTHRSNFFLGNDPLQWAGGVPNFQEIVYEELYHDIDLVFRTVPDGIKYEFVVRPGGNVGDIGMRYEGVGLEVTPDGRSLIIGTSVGTVIDGGLYVYQEKDDRRDPVEARFLVNDYLVSFDVDHDPKYTLVIDPLVFSTYFGGSSQDEPRSLALDTADNPYMTGFTYSTNFPTTPGAYCQTLEGNADIFVVKLKSDGSDLLYSTFIGGTGGERGSSLALDSLNNAYVVGGTASSDFPTTSGVYCETVSTAVAGNGEIVLFKLNPDGSDLLYSTYVGGSYRDTGTDIALDSDNNTVVIGESQSDDFPFTSSAFGRVANGGVDIVLFKMNSTATGLIWSTYIGGDKDDENGVLVLDPDNNPYIAGSTLSSNFPTTPGAFNRTYNYYKDLFIARVNSDGSGLVYSTYVGGVDDEEVYDIAIDQSKYVYITGYTKSSSFPTTSEAFDRGFSYQTDGFILKLNQDGSDLVYSTFIGGEKFDSGRSITVNSTGFAIITGSTNSFMFPLTNKTYCATDFTGSESFLLFLSNDGSEVAYSSCFGGSSGETGVAVAIDSSEDVYIAGITVSSDFPITQGAYCATFHGSLWTGYILKMDPIFPPTPPRNLSATAGRGYVNLSWSPPGFAGSSEIINYMIYRALPTQASTVLASLGVVMSYNDTNVTNNQTYYYGVAAVNSHLEGGGSGSGYVTPVGVPTEPLNVTLLPGEGCINLTWLTPADDGGFEITNYTIYKGFNEFALDPIGTIGNETFFSDANVSANITYYYMVRAISSFGNGTLSEIVSGMAGRRPLWPQCLAVEGIVDMVILDWDEPRDDGGMPLRYRIQRGPHIDDLAFLNETNMTAYNDTSVTNGKVYYYAVTAVNDIGESYKSTVQAAYPGSVPDAPVLNASVENDHVELSWTSGHDGWFEVKYYNIYKGDDVGDLTIIKQSSGNVTTDKDVVPGRTYHYAVSAVNIKGEGAISNVIDIRIEGVPGQVENLTAMAGDRNVLLKWSAPANTGGAEINNYIIFRGHTLEEMEPIASSIQTSYEDRNVTNDLLYYYSVAATNKFGIGAQSELVTADPQGLPGKVGNLMAEAFDRNVSLQWTPPVDTGGSAIERYFIYRGLTVEGMSMEASVKEAHYFDEYVENGITYYYSVKVSTKVGTGEFSDIVNATPGTPPEAPMSLQYDVKGGKIVLKWTDSLETGGFDVIKYRIYRGTTEDNMKPIAYETNNSYKDKTVKPGYRYFYKISAVNEKGEGGATDVISVKVPKDASEVASLDMATLSWLSFAILVVVIVTVFVFYCWKSR